MKIGKIVDLAPWEFFETLYGNATQSIDKELNYKIEISLYCDLQTFLSIMRQIQRDLFKTHS